MDQSNLLKKLVGFDNKYRPRTIEVQHKERDTYKSAYTLYIGRELILNGFKSGIFPIKATKSEGLKILTPRQILQRLPRALAQAKVGNISQNLANEVRQIMYSSHRAKEITKNVHNNIRKSIKV